MLSVGVNRFDKWLSDRLRIVTRVWQKITGRDCIDLAILMFSFGVGMMLSYVVVDWIRHFDWTVPLSLLILVASSWFTFALLVTVAEEIRITLEQGELRITARFVDMLCHLRQRWFMWWAMNAFFMTFDHSLVEFLIFGGLTCITVAQYVVFHVDTGPRQTIWSQAKSWLAAHRPQLGPVVVPA
jgi:hypothetical protein